MVFHLTRYCTSLFLVQRWPQSLLPKSFLGCILAVALRSFVLARTFLITDIFGIKQRIKRQEKVPTLAVAGPARAVPESSRLDEALL